MLVKKLVRRGILGLVFAVVAAAANAQISLRVTPDNPVPGAAVTIEYSNPALAGTDVDININDSTRPNPQTAKVTIRLGADGKGVGAWTLPACWDTATFNAPGAQEVTIFINDGE